MNLKIIERRDLDVQKWDSLVDRTKEASLFSYSFYLDAVAEHWCVLTDEDFSVGVALPYTIRAKRKILYTPIFVSYLELLGAISASNPMKELILNAFKTIEIEFKQPILGTPQQVFVTQFLNRDLKRKGQVNRMLNKAKRSALEIIQTDDWKAVFAILSSELRGKFSGMTDLSLSRLEHAYSEAHQRKRLKIFEIQKGNRCVGGVICIQNNDFLLYSKGACEAESRDEGGMYAAIDAAINYANEGNLNFDFGGSRVEGVRRFNLAFGGEDAEYYSYQLDKSPLWFRWMRKLKKRFRKKS